MNKARLHWCIGIHAVLYIAALVWLMTVESIARVFDQMTETFEFLFSPLPLENSYLLSNPSAEKITEQLLVIFIVTALPSYVIGYSLFSKFVRKHYA